MPTDVVMPQMGESITEGTITKWLKKPGDTVQRDEPLFEISTDKVDAEIPSPAAGTSEGDQDRRGHDRPDQHGRLHDRRSGRGFGPCRCACKGGDYGCPLRQLPLPRPRLQLPLRQLSGDQRRRRPGHRCSDAADGRVHHRGHHHQVAQEGWRQVQRDEPIFEISTDKVDAEIPSPVAGTLTEIKVAEGTTVTDQHRRRRDRRRRRQGCCCCCTCCSSCTCCSPPPLPAPAAPHRSDGRRARSLFAAGAQDCEGQQRRSHPGSRHRAPRAASPRATSSAISKAERSLPPRLRLQQPLLLRQRPSRPRRSRSPASSFRCRRCAPSLRSAWSSPSAPARTSTPSSRWT